MCGFTDGVLGCLVAESSVRSFEQTDESFDDNESSTQTSDELGSGSPDRGEVHRDFAVMLFQIQKTWLICETVKIHTVTCTVNPDK